MSAIVNTLSTTLQASPGNWKCRLALIEALVSENRSDEARAVLSEVTELPPDLDSRLAAARAYGILEPALGIEILDGIISENPSCAPAYFQKAVLYREEGNHDQAIPQYSAATALDPGLVDPDFAASLGLEAPSPRLLVHPVPLSPPVNLETGPVALSSPPPVPAGVPVINEEEFHPGHLVTDTGESIADLQESIRRNRAEKESENARREKIEKIQSFVVALITLVGICFLMIMAVVAVPRPTPPQVVVSSVVSPDDDSLETATIKQTRITPTPTQSASAMSMEVVTVASASNISMMSFDSPTVDLGSASFGNDFGSSMSFGDTVGGGMVSFFGSRSSSRKVVFVVDASASMKAKGSNGKTKMDLMKEELTKTVQALPPGIEFQILFFSGPSWFLGQEPQQAKKDWKQNPPGKNFWEYKGGDPAKWPDVKYVRSSKSQLKKTIEEIQSTPMMLGTDWRDPLKMAIRMKPDTIYFMTDGAVGKNPSKPDVVKDVLEFNKKNSNAKINSVCLMVLKAADNLKELADETKGEFTLVLEDGTSLRGRDLEKLMKK